MGSMRKWPVRRARRPLGVLAVLACCWWTLEARGALVRLGFDELVDRSTVIVCGEVVELVSYEAPFLGSGFCVFTDVTLRVTRTIKGRVTDGRVTLQILGGALDDRRQLCPASARFRRGEHVLVFAAQYNDALWTTGWLQGKYSLADDATTVKGGRGLPISRDLPLERVVSQIQRLRDEETSGSKSSGSGDVESSGAGRGED